MKRAALVVLGLGGCSCSDAIPVVATDAPGEPDAGADAWAGHCRWEQAPPGPGGAVESGPLLAGAAEGLLDQPIGTPQGGYLGRSTTVFGQGDPIDGRTSPFAQNLVPSVGVQTRIPVRALVLDNGSDVVFLVKADLPYLYDGSTFVVEAAVAKATGVDARGRVLLAASHSHAAPGRVSGHFLYQQGMDLYLGEAVDRLAEAVADVAGRAYKSRAPARIGVGVWDGWDPDGEVYRDRRDVNDDLTGGSHKDERLTVLRVDRADGTPLALVHSFGMHGTIGDASNPYLSVDSTGHVDLELEERFAEPVVVMHLQGAAGDASPAGAGTIDSSCATDDDCHGMAVVDREVECGDGECGDVIDFGKMESIGDIAAPRILALWEVTQAGAEDVELELLTRSVPIGPDITVERAFGTLRYNDFDEEYWADGIVFEDEARLVVATPLDEYNVPYGTFGCGGTAPLVPGWTIPGATYVPEYETCLDLRLLPNLAKPLLNIPTPRLPLCETLSTTVSVLRVGRIDRTVSDGESGSTETVDLVVAFLPGEPTALLAEAFRDRAPTGADASWVVGYAADNKGYLLLVEDWLRQGYEPSINVWGPLEGEWLLDQALALADLAVTPARDDAEAGFPRPVYPDAPRLDRIADSATPGVPDDVPATLFVRLRTPPASPQPDAAIPRVTGRAVFVWRGRDPQEDRARVTLERQDEAGVWEPVVRRSGRPVDDRGKEIIVTYTPDPLDPDDPSAPRTHYYAAEWQAVAWEGDAAHPNLEDFAGVDSGVYRLCVDEDSLCSDPFEVVPVTLEVSAESDGGILTAYASYPAGPGYRLLDLAVPSNGPVPVRGGATVELLDAGGAVLASATLAGAVEGTSTRYDVDAMAGVATTLRVTDRFGNAGEIAVP